MALLSQNQRQAVLAVSNHDDFRIGALRKTLGGFNSLPFQQLRADSLRHNLLEVPDAGRFNPLALGFLCLLGWTRRPAK